MNLKNEVKILLYTFRYYRATIEYVETGRVVDVMTLLGHTSTKYVTKYAQLAKIYFGGARKYKSIWVTNREQETEAVNDGYEYVRTDLKDGASLNRKHDHSGASTLIGHD
jgi:hypothetical protein